MSPTTLLCQKHRPRVLGVFAHPDDETFCAGATFAQYAAAGSDIMVVSATRGQAGQIRSADLATRKTLAAVREAELRLACSRLGVERVECWDYQDGMLAEVKPDELHQRIAYVLGTFEPDVVFTFDDDGAYGHPDHIAISRATTGVCRFGGPDLFHATFPHRRRRLQDHLVRWLVQEGPDFRGDPEFVHGLLLLAEEASALHCVDDYYEVKWFPTGFPIIEQGEAATTLFLLLSGHADVVREDEHGERTHVVRLEPGQFFGEQGIARALPRNAHVIAAEGATCLVIMPAQPTLFEGRGEGARLVTGDATMAAGDDLESELQPIEAGTFLRQKLQALAAYRSQFPFEPDMLPEDVFRDLFGTEYFIHQPDLAEIPDSQSGGRRAILAHMGESASGELMVRCECGFEFRGSPADLIATVQQHCRNSHNMQATLEQILEKASRVLP